MPLPYKIATLLYCFNERDEVLLLERAQDPNRGFWSPGGGKLKTDLGESPYTRACREAHEEMGLVITPCELHLTGLVSESGSAGQAHWLMFLFEVKTKLTATPLPHAEGTFRFFRALNCPRCTSRRPTGRRSGRCSGSIAADFSPRTVIATPAVVTTGRWKKHSLPSSPSAQSSMKERLNARINLVSWENRWPRKFFGQQDSPKSKILTS